MLRLNHVAFPDSPTLRVTTAAQEHSCIADGERYEYTGQVRDKDFQQQTRQVHIVALVLWRSLESRPKEATFALRTPGCRRSLVSLVRGSKGSMLLTCCSVKAIPALCQVDPGGACAVRAALIVHDIAHSGIAGAEEHASAMAFLRACARSLPGRRSWTANSVVLPSVRFLLGSLP